jgi:hypothetical protein
MKYSIAVLALLGLASGVQQYAAEDPRKGTSSQPIPHAPLGAMAKPHEAFKVPKNTDHEPALSTTLDPYDYESGSGKTYHNKKTDKKEEGNKKPAITAGQNESTETAGTTTLWKSNTGDSPAPVKVADEDSTINTEDAKPKKKKEKAEDVKEEKEEPKKEKKEEKADAKEEKAEKPKETEEDKAESESFAQRFGLHPTPPVSNTFLQTELEVGCEPAIDVSQK